MAVYINYVNQKNLFILNESYNEYLNEAFIDFNLQLSDVFNTNHIKEKLKELLFQTLPVLKNASLKIIQFILKLLILICHRMIKKISNSISNVYEGIKEIFNNISNVISKFITRVKTNIYEISLNLIDSFIEEGQEKEVREKLNDVKESFIINSSEVDKINQFCKIEEIQIFALETEDNYLCLPFTDNDEQNFKVIKTANYYDSYFDITDQESSDILDTLIEFKEKGTRIFQKKIGNTPVFTYKIVENESEGLSQWDGIFIPNIDLKVRECFYDNDNKKTKYMYMYGVFVHEFIHYKDWLINKDKFTNWDLQNNILTKLSGLKKDKIISYDNFKNIIKKKVFGKQNTDSEARYIIAILQKKKYIDYVNNDFSKIKINFLPEYEAEADKEGQYFNTPMELNTHLNNVIQASLKDFRDFKKKKEQTEDPFFIYKEMKIKNEKIKNTDFPEIAFTNKEYTKMYESFKKYKNNQKFVDSIKLFFNYMHFNKESTDFSVDVTKNKKETMKNYKKFVTSPFIKMMNLSSEELIEILKKVAKKNSSEVQTAFRDIILSSNKIFKEVYQNYCNYKNSTYNDSDLEFIIEDHVSTKVNSIFDEILNRNKYKQNFKNVDDREKFRDKLTKIYKKKVFEKLKNYQENISTNKEKFDKLETD